MYNSLGVGERRRVLDANFNFHRKGELHPDRVLDFHDIVYILEGSWEIGQDGLAYPLEKGDAIFLHAGHHHYGVTGRLPGVRTMYAHLSRLPDDAASEAAGEGDGEGWGLTLPVVVRCGDSVAVRSVFTDIISAFWSDIPHRNIRLAALADLLLAELGSVGRGEEGRSDALVGEALELIRLTPGRILTLDELADRLHVCSRSLTARFRRATGSTVHRYQLDLKLEMARMHIRGDPGRPFKDLAETLGFCDEFHFSRLFSGKYGLSPAQFRKQIK